MKLLSLVTAISLSTMTAASAQMSVAFIEGAPKDRFVFSNNSECDLKGAKIILDLSGSKAGLIFDVTAQGAGVEVFQPLEMVRGAAMLSNIPSVKDGDNRIVLNTTKMAAGETIAFTIDVDDTLGGREITVNTSEIKGATATLVRGGSATSAPFGNSAEATIDIGPCKVS